MKREEEEIIREMLWMSHGCVGMYGDDGEMQCATVHGKFGFLDFKRDPIDKLIKGSFHKLLSALEAAQEENKGLREAVKEYLAIHSEPDIPLEDAIEEARKNNGWLHRSLSALEKMEQALSRTEKEGGG